MKIIDRYIIRKFLGTFLYSIALLSVVIIIFDLSEKIDDFLEKEAPLRMLVALLCNLFVLPSLLLSLDKKITTRNFSEPYLEIFDEEIDIELDDLKVEIADVSELKKEI
jgi:hypothetical protein